MMNSITGFMAKDHDQLDNIFAEFRSMRKTDMVRAKALFHDFMRRLQRHIVWEEDILFPVFEDKTGMYDAGPVAVMRMEHCHIKDCLEQIFQKISTEEMQGIDGQEDALFAILAGHNNKEENVLYPWIDRETSEREQEDIISRMKNSSME